MKNENKEDMPILDVMVTSINDFLTKFMKKIPKTYYVHVIVGNDHPDMVTIPVSKIFKGNKPPIQIDRELLKLKECELE